MHCNELQAKRSDDIRVRLGATTRKIGYCGHIPQYQYFVKTAPRANPYYVPGPGASGGVLAATSSSAPPPPSAEKRELLAQNNKSSVLFACGVSAVTPPSSAAASKMSRSASASSHPGQQPSGTSPMTTTAAGTPSPRVLRGTEGVMNKIPRPPIRSGEDSTTERQFVNPHKDGAAHGLLHKLVRPSTSSAVIDVPKMKPPSSSFGGRGFLGGGERADSGEFAGTLSPPRSPLARHRQRTAAAIAVSGDGPTPPTFPKRIEGAGGVCCGVTPLDHYGPYHQQATKEAMHDRHPEESAETEAAARHVAARSRNNYNPSIAAASEARVSPPRFCSSARLRTLGASVGRAASCVGTVSIRHNGLGHIGDETINVQDVGGHFYYASGTERLKSTCKLTPFPRYPVLRGPNRMGIRGLESFLSN